MTPRKAAILGFIGATLMRAIYATLRVRFDDRAGALTSTEPRAVWLFWHNRLFMVPYVWLHTRSRKEGAALISASKDGEILAAFLKRFRLRPVRGSSSRRGVAALMELIRLVESGFDVGITPDGPRGPRYTFNPGAITLAQKTGAKIIPVRLIYSSFWQIKSWDGFMIPKPFSEVDITLLPMETVQCTDTEETFESERNRIAAILREGQGG
jgi:lysophospholipid acyltransferase (LPLAT)-like uncharacterized protein